MSVTLSQTGDGLNISEDRVDHCMTMVATPGLTGQGLQYVLNQAQATLNLSAMLAPDTMAGGELVLVRLLGASGQWLCSVVYDADLRVLSLRAEDQALSASALDRLAWHHVEVSMDTVAGTISLYIDGQKVGGLAGLSLVNASECSVGVLAKERDVVGTMRMDEIRLGDGYLGPSQRLPSSDYADAPERWLVLYNRDVQDADQWAQAYRDSRDVPYANCLGLSLGSEETISLAEYLTLSGTVDSYLNDNALSDQVIGILCGHGVPGLVDVDGQGKIEPVAALMVSSGSTGPLLNPFAQDALPIRPTADELKPIRLTARIDGVSLSDSLEFVDRANSLEALDELPPMETTLWFDPFFSDGPLAQVTTQNWIQWGEGVDRQHLRLPIQWSRDPETYDFSEAHFSSVLNDGFYFGWSDSDPSMDFFSESSGTRVVCIQSNVVAASHRSLRQPLETDWPTAAINAGYAAAIADGSRA